MDELLPNSSLILYQTEDGSTRIEVRLLDETVWLSQAQMTELFDKDKRTISEHIKNIFNEGELKENAVVRNFRTTAAEYVKYQKQRGDVLSPVEEHFLKAVKEIEQLDALQANKN